jgi:hypothetical protein
MRFGKNNGRMVRGQTFWAQGHWVVTVGLDEVALGEYIRNQKRVDRLQEELA